MDGKSFFEVFPTLKVKEELSDIFKGVIVENVYSTRRHDRLRVRIASEYLIEKRDIRSMENSIKSELFPDATMDIILQEGFNLSDAYTPEYLYREYKESLLFELKNTSPVMYTMLKKADVSFGEDNTMVLKIERLLPYVAKEDEFKDYLEKVFHERCGVGANIKIEFEDIKEEDTGLKTDDIKIRRQISMISANLYNEDISDDINADDEKLLSMLDENEKADSKSKEEGKGSGAGNEKHEKKNAPSFEKGGSFKSRKRKTCDDPNVIWGNHNIENDTLAIEHITGDIGRVTVRGKVFGLDQREIKKIEKTIVSFVVTDFTDSIKVKLFVPMEEAGEFVSKLDDKNVFVKLEGNAEYDDYDRETVISHVSAIELIKDFRVKRVDDAPEKRVELHCHTKMSDMDGVSDVNDIVKRAYSWGHPAIAITDHGVVQALADAGHTWDDLFKAYKGKCKEEGKKASRDDFFKVILGVEGYLVDDTKDIINDPAHFTLDDDFVVFDIETTGFSPEKNKIIEIGAVRVEGGKIKNTFSVFVNPHEPIPSRIITLTGITDDDVKDAGDIEDILPAFLEFSKGAALIAHNARFDMSFMRYNAKKQGLRLNETYGDTMLISRFLFPKQAKHTLDACCKTLNVSLENHHRAVDDATATAHIFVKFIELLKDRGINTLKELNEAGEDNTETVKKLRMNHVVILAKNEIGRVNLYRLISDSHLKYFARKPRIPKSELIKHREGLIIGSACCAGEVFEALVSGRSRDELYTIADFYDYLEIQPIANNRFMIESTKPDYEGVTSEEDLRELNRQIVKLGERLNKPVCATCDVHFLDPEDEIYRTIIHSNRKEKGDEESEPLFLRTTEEMLDEFSYLGSEKAYEVVVKNTNLVADAIENISPVRPDKSPPVIEDSDKTLREICENRAHEIYGEELPDIVRKRMDKELNSIISNGFAVMYIIAQKLVWKSVEDGYLVGSRGSVGSSFVAFLAGITEVNSLSPHYYCPECHFSDFDSEEVKKYSGMAGCDMPDRDCPVCGKKLKKDGFDIPFETFLGFKGDKEPDIDLNFSGEYQSNAHKYTEVIFGKGQTFKAGTISTLADKTAYGFALKHFENKGIVKRRCEIERLSAGCTGVWRSTGQHPGGIVVLPKGEEINSFTPIQHPANDMTSDIITTHFDYHKIDHNLLKLDILGHDDPTMIRMLQDTTGLDPVTIPLDDKEVMSLFQGTDALKIKPEDIDGIPTGSLGIPEFGTKFVIQMLVDTKPQCFTDLVRISGLSHGTDVWLGNAQTVIAEGKATISTAICTRDDIMVYLINKGIEEGLAFTIMERIRKGAVAKGKVPEWEEWKELMRQHGVPDWYIWSAEKIKYMFPKAHAAAYVMMAWRIAYYKVNFPLQYYAAYFSIRAKGFDYKRMCMGKAEILRSLNELKEKKANKEISAAEEETLDDLYLVLEMYARGYEFEPIDIYRADATKFKVMDGKIMPAFNSISGMGDKAAESLMKAAATAPFTSKDDLKNRGKISKTIIDDMDEMGLLGDIPESDQISLFDLR